jgi:hypothetical protein
MPVRIIFYRKAFVISELRCVAVTAVTAVTAVAERSRSQPKSAEVSGVELSGVLNMYFCAIFSFGRNVKEIFGSGLKS